MPNFRRFPILLAALAAFAIAAPDSAHSQDVGPITIAKTGHFFVGGKYVDSKEGQVLAGQSYVEYYIPQNRTHPWPIVFIEGCCPSGAPYMSTPDGRDGWGQYFLSKGYAVYIMDQVGRGRSPYIASVYGSAKARTPHEIEKEFIAVEKYNMFPQAKLHTQWPGSGTVGDPVFDQFLAAMFPNQGSGALRETINRDVIVALLDKIGPAILAPHSQSGSPVWLAADARPQLVKGLLMVEAGSSSFYDIKLVGAPEWYQDGELSKPFGVSRAPITYDPPVKGIEDFTLVREEKPDAPDLARCWVQKEPGKKLINFKNIPTLQMSAEASFGAPVAHCNAKFLKSAGVPLDFIKLADIGIKGNGHFLMLEKNNMEIAKVIADWMDKRITPNEKTASAEKK